MMKYRKFLAIGVILLSGCNIPAPLTQTATSMPATQLLSQNTLTPTVPTQLHQPVASDTPTPTSTNQATLPFPIDRSNAASLTKTISIQKDNISRIVWLPDGKSLAVISYKQFSILSLPDLKVLKEINYSENESLLDFEPLTGLLAITTDRNSVIIKDLDGKVIQTIAPPGGFGSATFSPTGDSIWFSSMEKLEANAYNIESGEITQTCDGFETAAPVYRAFPSAQGKWLVWIARATIQLNSIPSCQPGVRIGHEDFIISFAFNADEKILATSTGGTLNGEFLPLIYFWDAQTGSQTGTIQLTDTPATGLAFSPNDEVLASAGSGLTIWDPATQKELISLSTPGERFLAVEFSPDGSYLAAADEKSISLFSIQP